MFNQIVNTGNWYQLIVLNDKICIDRSFIRWVEWADNFVDPATLKPQTTIKGVVIGFNGPGPNDTGTYSLIGEEALEFWYQYTGRRASWDERVTPKVYSEFVTGFKYLSEDKG